MPRHAHSKRAGTALLPLHHMHREACNTRPRCGTMMQLLYQPTGTHTTQRHLLLLTAPARPSFCHGAHASWPCHTHQQPCPAARQQRPWRRQPGCPCHPAQSGRPPQGPAQLPHAGQQQPVAVMTGAAAVAATRVSATQVDRCAVKQQKGGVKAGGANSLSTRCQHTQATGRSPANCKGCGPKVARCGFGAMARHCCDQCTSLAACILAVVHSHQVPHTQPA